MPYNFLMDQFKKRPKTPGHLCLSGLLVTFVFAAGCASGSKSSSRNEAFELATAAGLPKSWEDLRQPYNREQDMREPLAEFAKVWKPEWVQASRMHPTAVTGYGDQRPGRTGDTSYILSALTTKVLQRSELAIFEKPEQGFGAITDFVWQTSAPTDYLATRSRVLSIHGQPIKALEVLTDATKLVRLLRPEVSSMESEMTAKVNERVLVGAAFQVLNLNQSNPEVQSASLKFLEALGRPPDVRRTMQANFARVLLQENRLNTKGKAEIDVFLRVEETLDESSEGKLDPIVEQLRTELKDPANRDSMFERYFRAVQQLYKDLPEDPNDGYGRLEAAKKHAVLNEQRTQQLDYLASFQLAETYSNIDGDLRDLVMRRSLKALVLALQAQAKTGSFPQELPLSGLEAIDPYSGKKLMYKQDRGGLVVYAVGPDSEDNGGDDVGSISNDPRDVGLRLIARR
jgi:hypothetical protein